jgi:N-acetylmuramoyl-L-alanine amidase
MKRPRINKFVPALLLLTLAFFLSGCATAPMRESFSKYSLHGTTYFSLSELCQSRGVSLEYDSVARTVILSKDNHKINLMVQDKLALVDGVAKHLNEPVDFYRDKIVVPQSFKSNIFDAQFKGSVSCKIAFKSLSSIKKIVIDAGHGGRDPGAIGRTGLKEKDVNLDIAKRLGNILKEQGVEIIFTRKGDNFISLTERAETANMSGADLFISIHSNSSRARSLNGFEVYCVSTDESDSRRGYKTAQETLLNLDKACFASDSLELKAILWDMIYTSSRAESVELSKGLCKTIKNNLGVKILGVKDANFQVLRLVYMPAVLIETGFLSNLGEESKLKNSYYRETIAESISEALCAFAKDFTVMEAHKR